jgi:hypothetical protein
VWRREGDDLPSRRVIGEGTGELSAVILIPRAGHKVAALCAVYPPIVEEIEVTYESGVAEFDEEPVFQWRRDQLEQAGYDPCSAVELAGRADIDLHVAVSLRARGCPSETAVRILI